MLPAVAWVCAARRHGNGMIENADHMYTGEEAQVAQVIAKWADSLVRMAPGNDTLLDRR